MVYLAECGPLIVKQFESMNGQTTMRISFWILFVAAVFSFSNRIAKGHPILGSELVETDNGDADGSTTLLSDLDTGVVSADNFMLNTATELTGVRWWGGFTGIGPAFPAFPAGMVYSLTIYSGDTSPGAVVDTSTLTLDGVPSPDVVVSPPGTAIWEINATLDSHVSGLAPGTNYWISIVSAAADGNGNAVWASSDDTGNAYANFSGGVGSWSGPQGAELAFVLFSDSVVPEPTSLTLFAIGAVGFVAYGWRRRKRETDIAG